MQNRIKCVSSTGSNHSISTSCYPKKTLFFPFIIRRRQEHKRFLQGEGARTETRLRMCVTQHHYNDPVSGPSEFKCLKRLHTRRNSLSHFIVYFRSLSCGKMALRSFLFRMVLKTDKKLVTSGSNYDATVCFDISLVGTSSPHSQAATPV